MIELILPDMTCGHCVKVVTQTVQQIDAGATLSIDLPSHKVQIDTGADAAQLRTALAAQGYPAQA